MEKPFSDVREGECLWTPSPARIARANVTRFQDWLERERGLRFGSYAELWHWSVTDLDAFWQAVWDYFGVESSAPHERVLGRRTMPGAEWFPGARLNFAQHILRNERAGETALLHLSERQPLTEMDWSELAGAVRILATQLRDMGIRPGDRVVAYLPNIPQAVIALLATTAIGAIWSSVSPDFGSRGVLDRLRQLEPKLLFCVDGYRYGGKAYDRGDELRTIVDGLSTLEHLIFLPYLDPDNVRPPRADARLWQELMDRPAVPAAEFEFEQLPFDHPLWILFSSGTTGLPKAIVHGHGGILVEQFKAVSLQMDLNPGDRMFFFSTTGWMMWNFLVSAMLQRVAPVLYDGNPAWPDVDVLWKMAQDCGARYFGSSPTFVDIMIKSGVVPKERYDLSRLETIVAAGSPVTPAHTAWFYQSVKEDLWVAIGSGGTDICSGFVGGVATLPVYAGEIQAATLGVAARAFDDAGNSVVDQVGEMVVTEPMPSMPLYFWNDPGNERYLGSYFEDFPGLWRQGDFFKVNARGGCFVLGRSDATLNRHGIRIGTAEIYNAVESIPDIDGSLIVNLDLPGGHFFMPLFVKLRAGATLDEALQQAIKRKLREEYTPRHVPDRIIAVPDIPVTLTGKKMEVPVRKMLIGVAVDKAANRNAMANPQSLDWFAEYARTQTDYALKEI